jgi:signal transduction histidine kinase
MGTLVLASIGEIRLPTPEEVELLEALAKQAALGIAKARLISDLTEAHKNLRNLSEQLMRVQEEERRSLARELHDEVGQQLTLLSSQLSQACQSLAGSPEATGILNQLAQSHELVKHLITEVRDLSFTLRPSLLDDLGLLPTLHAYFERYEEQSGIQVNFRHTGVDRRFPPRLKRPLSA